MANVLGGDVSERSGRDKGKSEGEHFHHGGRESLVVVEIILLLSLSQFGFVRVENDRVLRAKNGKSFVVSHL